MVQKEAADVIESLRPKALKGSLTDYEVQRLEDAFVVFNRTKWSRQAFLPPEVSPAGRSIGVPEGIDPKKLHLSDSESSAISRWLDTELSGDVSHARSVDEATTKAALGTDAAGSTLGIPPERLLLASAETRARIDDLARGALAVRTESRGIDGKVRAVAQAVDEAHALIIDDFRSKGLLDEAAEMSQTISKTINEITRNIVDDATEYANIQAYRATLEDAAQITSYNKTDALAEAAAAKEQARAAVALSLIHISEPTRPY